MGEWFLRPLLVHHKSQPLKTAGKENDGHRRVVEVIFLNVERMDIDIQSIYFHIYMARETQVEFSQVIMLCRWKRGNS